MAERRPLKRGCVKGWRIVAFGGTCRCCRINDAPIVCPLGSIVDTSQHIENPSLAAARKLLAEQGPSDMLWNFATEGKKEND